MDSFDLKERRKQLDIELSNLGQNLSVINTKLSQNPYNRDELLSTRAKIMAKMKRLKLVKNQIAMDQSDEFIVWVVLVVTQIECGSGEDMILDSIHTSERKAIDRGQYLVDTDNKELLYPYGEMISSNLDGFTEHIWRAENDDFVHTYSMKLNETIG